MSNIEQIAKLAIVDRNLDDLEEEFGDLPQKLREQEDKVSSHNSLVEETTEILKELVDFCKSTKKILVELKDKEDALSKQQFLVRNNKEFDAITSEIKYIKEEYATLSDKLRSEAIKEENLKNILEEQKAEFQKEKIVLDELEKEVSVLSKDQDDELKQLNDVRGKILEQIETEMYLDYKKIRSYHKEAAVRIKKNHCTGCFSSIPAQLVVEIRNNLDKIHKCENCGRILIPEEIIFDDSIIEEV